MIFHILTQVVSLWIFLKYLVGQIYLCKKIIFKIIQMVTAISSTAAKVKTKTYWNKTKNSFNKTTKNNWWTTTVILKNLVKQVSQMFFTSKVNKPWGKEKPLWILKRSIQIVKWMIRTHIEVLLISPISRWLNKNRLKMTRIVRLKT